MQVWATRDEPGDGPLSTALRRAGLDVIHEPVLQRRVITSAAEFVAQLTADDWLVLTSPFAIECIDARRASVPRVAVVGDASRQAADAKGLRVELVSPDQTSLGLFNELRRIVRRGTVCYARSSLAIPPKAWPGVELICPVLYDTVQRAFDRDRVGRADVVCVTSPSAVEALGPTDLRYASIGPTTSRAIRRLGKKPWIEAPDRSFSSLATAIAERTKRD